MKKLSISKTFRYGVQLVVSPSSFIALSYFPELLKHITTQVAGIPNCLLLPLLMPPVFVYLTFLREARGKPDIAIRIILSLLLLGLILGTLVGSGVKHKYDQYEWCGMLYIASCILFFFDLVYWIFKKFIP